MSVAEACGGHRPRYKTALGNSSAVFSFVNSPRFWLNRIMRIVSRVAAMQQLAVRWKRAGMRVGFVPTMGYLHAGHLSLVNRARRAVGKNGVVVVSIYVNPTQFGPKEDFSKYPRDLKRDLKLCRAAGVAVAFTPRDKEMYPRWGESLASLKSKPQKAWARRSLAPPVSAPTSSRKNCRKRWKARRGPTHFRGVTTVVAKLVQSRAAGCGSVRPERFSTGGHHQTHGRGFEFPG